MKTLFIALLVLASVNLGKAGSLTVIEVSTNGFASSTFEATPYWVSYVNSTWGQDVSTGNWQITKSGNSLLEIAVSSPGGTWDEITSWVCNGMGCGLGMIASLLSVMAIRKGLRVPFQGGGD